MTRVFAYIIRTVGARYRLTGYVPWVSQGKVFFGPCKKTMRPDVDCGDYILGISGAAGGNPRRVLLWMRVVERLTFAEAYDRGKTDSAFRAIRGKAIHVRPHKLVAHVPGDPECYRHIQGAPHSDDWQTDIKGSRDVFLVGGRYSWVAGNEGPEVTEDLVALLRQGIQWKGNSTIRNPLTEHARGRHVLVTGRTAQEIISWVPQMQNPPYFLSGPRTTCIRTCSCN